MKQIAKNLTDPFDGFLLGKRYLIMDRDTKFSDAFRKILEDEGVESVRLPPRSPNLTPHIERFMRSIKDEALDRMILFGERMLRSTTREYLFHYHAVAISACSFVGSPITVRVHREIHVPHRLDFTATAPTSAENPRS